MNNYLKDKQCYLSGPIQFGEELDWRSGPKKVLEEKFAIYVFDPVCDPKQQWVPLLNESRFSNGRSSRFVDCIHST